MSTLLNCQQTKYHVNFKNGTQVGSLDYDQNNWKEIRSDFFIHNATSRKTISVEYLL